MRGTLSLAAVLAGMVAAPAVALADDVNLAGPGFVPVTVPDGVDASSVELAGTAPPVTSTAAGGRTVLHFDKRARADGDDLQPAADGHARRPDAVTAIPSRSRRPCCSRSRRRIPRACASAFRRRRWSRSSPTSPRPRSPASPDFTAMQTDLRPSPVGTDADFSRRDPRARGAGIRIADLEYYWNSTHEDLQLTAANDLGGTAYPQYTAFGDEHGTGVGGAPTAAPATSPRRR